MNPCYPSNQGAAQARSYLRLDKKYEGLELKAFVAVLDAVRVSEEGLNINEIHAICERKLLSMQDTTNARNLGFVLDNFCICVNDQANYNLRTWKLGALYLDGRYLSADASEVFGGK